MWQEMSSSRLVSTAGKLQGKVPSETAKGIFYHRADNPVGKSLTLTAVCGGTSLKEMAKGLSIGVEVCNVAFMQFIAAV